MMWYTKSGYVIYNIYKGLSNNVLKPEYIVDVSSVGLFRVSDDLILCIKDYNVPKEIINKVKEEVKELLKDMNLI